MPLRNYIQRRNHKERSQLSHRKKLGLLEKHKDYVQRARDHHSKRDRIKRLREKALDRNKDEFYFGMVKGRTERGVHIQDRGNEALSASIVALMKTQDAAYVRRQITAEKKRIDALIADIAPNVAQMRVAWLEEKENRLAALRAAELLDKPRKGKGKGKALQLDEDRGDGKVGTQGKRTVWVDGVDEVRKYAVAGPSTLHAPTRDRSLIDYDLEDLDDDVLLNEGDIELSGDDAAADDDDVGEDEGSSSGRSQSPDLDEAAEAAEADTARRRRRAERHWSYLLSLLRARQKRLEALQTAAERLGIVRALMANKGGTSVRKISSQKEAITDLVAKGKMTKNGLALPGNEDEDEEDDAGGNGRRGKPKAVFKWGKERKR